MQALSLNYWSRSSTPHSSRLQRTALSHCFCLAVIACSAPDKSTAPPTDPPAQTGASDGTSLAATDPARSNPVVSSGNLAAPSSGDPGPASATPGISTAPSQAAAAPVSAQPRVETALSTADVYQTSRAGDNLSLIHSTSAGIEPPQQYETFGTLVLTLDPTTTFQEYFGFGASFTESSAWNLAAIPVETRREVLTRLFSPTEGAGFTLTRTHINSSDYSNNHYSYVADNDTTLNTFSVSEDLKGFSGDENGQVLGVPLEDSTYDLIPMILEAQSIPGADIKIIASPWSPPSWMKQGETAEMTNGRLLDIYQPTWAEYLSKYLTAYAAQGINIWAITPQNEPLHAADAVWDSNGWSATSARDFLKNHLGPRLELDGHLDPTDLERGVRVLIYDHNKSEMNEYVAPTYSDPEASKYAWGTAFHWYTNSQLADNDYWRESLDQLYVNYPDKVRIHTESSIDIDAADPIGQYWRRSRDHAGLFVPFTTYAYDIITDLNHWTQGYVEWCMILSNEGKPNPYNNFNSAPVLINPETDEITYTPLYYLLSHFSRFIRPGAQRIGLSSNVDDDGVIYTAAKNPDGSVALVVYNSYTLAYNLQVSIEGQVFSAQIGPESMQTIHLKP